MQRAVIPPSDRTPDAASDAGSLTALAAPTGFPSSYRLPFEGWRRITYGPCSNHSGPEAIDFQPRDQSDFSVYATRGGTVEFAGWQGAPNVGFGQYVKVRHPDTGYASYYAHLSRLGVRSGDSVIRGQYVGTSGRTGDVTGPHLHFEIRDGSGNPVRITGIPGIRSVGQCSPPSTDAYWAFGPPTDGTVLADLDGDGYVGLLDYVRLYENFGRGDCRKDHGDIVPDCKINMLDYSVFYDYFGLYRSQPDTARGPSRDDAALAFGQVPLAGVERASSTAPRTESHHESWPRTDSLRPQATDTATLSLAPATALVARGCPLTISVNLNTGNVAAQGADVVLRYDATRLTVSGSSFAPGALYPNYLKPQETVAGVLELSGGTSDANPAAVAGAFMSVTFTAKPDAPMGPAQIDFDFDPNNKQRTTDSNVVWNRHDVVVDVLDSAVGGSYVVGTGPCANPVPPVALTVMRQGDGSGSVSGPGVSCGADCSEYYAPDTPVTLLANAAEGSSFQGWVGPCSGAGPCEVVMNSARTVTARFRRNNVGVSVRRAPAPSAGDGALTTTLTAPSGCGPIDRIVFGPTGNTRVTITSPTAGPSDQTERFTYIPPQGMNAVTLAVRRAAPSGGAMVTVQFFDRCGEWRTFVGGGPTAF